MSDAITALLRNLAERWVAEVQRAELKQQESISKQQPEEVDSVEDDVPTTYVFELVERAYDRFLARLDALDAVLVGEFVAILAIAGIVVADLKNLDRGIWWFGFAFGFCSLGLLLGNGAFRPPDAIAPGPIAIAVSRNGEDALLQTIETLTRYWKHFQWLRLVKSATTGLILVLLATGLFVSAHEKMVNSVYDAHGQICTPPAKSLARTGGSRSEDDGSLGDDRKGYREPGFRLLRPLDRTPACVYEAEVACLLAPNAKPGEPVQQ